MTDQNTAGATPPVTTPDVQQQITELREKLDGVTNAIAAVERLAEVVDKLAKQPPTVPTTDGGARQTITPTTPDFTQLPPIARIAAGYRK
jgi:hypothetical protein